MSTMAGVSYIIKTKQMYGLMKNNFLTEQYMKIIYDIYKIPGF